MAIFRFSQHSILSLEQAQSIKSKPARRQAGFKVRLYFNIQPEKLR
jgi:hypothetical protein